MYKLYYLRKIMIPLIIAFFFIFFLYERREGERKGQMWVYNLPNGYSIHKINIDLVYLHEPEGVELTDQEIVFVEQFCFNNQWIIVKRIDRKGFHNKVITKSDDPEIYAIDSKLNKLYGPFKEKEIEDFFKKNLIVNLGEWIDTAYKPDEAISNIP